jgi:outer membrane protein
MRTLLLFLVAVPLWPQDALSLRDAVHLGLRENQSITASEAAIKAADAQVSVAKSGLLPKLNYTESVTRGNNPVYVFGSLLTQHQFSEQNFAVDTLNRPGFLDNFQSLIVLEQPIYDAGKTHLATKSAETNRTLSTEEKRRTQMNLVAKVVRTYWKAVLAKALLEASEQSVHSGEADLGRAENLRESGMATDADVLSIRVHAAEVREQRIERAAQLDVAQSALNDALGLPLDTPHQLTSSLAAVPVTDPKVVDLEHSASADRPEARETKLAMTLAEIQGQTARSAYKPTIFFIGAFEADRQDFADKGGANWQFGVALRWNLFNGFADREQVRAAGYQVARARAEERQMDSTIRLDVRRALAELRAANERVESARSVVAESEESLRITQNRYGAGMGNVTDVLRTEAAVSESKTRQLTAIHDQRIAAANLELVSGRLTPESEVLN